MSKEKKGKRLWSATPHWNSMERYKKENQMAVDVAH